MASNSWFNRSVMNLIFGWKSDLSTREILWREEDCDKKTDDFLSIWKRQQFSHRRNIFRSDWPRYENLWRLECGIVDRRSNISVSSHLSSPSSQREQLKEIWLLKQPVRQWRRMFIFRNFFKEYIAFWCEYPYRRIVLRSLNNTFFAILTQRIATSREEL